MCAALVCVCVCVCVYHAARRWHNWCTLCVVYEPGPFFFFMSLVIVIDIMWALSPAVRATCIVVWLRMMDMKLQRWEGSDGGKRRGWGQRGAKCFFFFFSQHWFDFFPSHQCEWDVWCFFLPAPKLNCYHFAKRLTNLQTRFLSVFWWWCICFSVVQVECTLCAAILIPHSLLLCCLCALSDWQGQNNSIWGPGAKMSSGPTSIQS